MLRLAPYLIAALLLAACQASGSQLSADDAIQHANAHFSEALPQVSMDRLTTKAEDLGNRWRVTYYPPKGSSGPASLSIEIDKQTGEVVKGLKGPKYIDG